MPNAILDPTGGSTRDTAPTGAAFARTARPGSVAGLRIGLMENTKRNAAELLAEIGRLLVEEHGAAAVALRATKPVFARPAPDEMVAEFVAACDVVITGVGDCGSCSASAVADGIAFERAGLPAAVICSDAFTATAEAMAAMRGAPDYPWAATAHPVAVLTPDEVRARAAATVPDVLALITR